MGSTHPPLDSLLTLSQTCLEGFEQSCLNRISNLRKELREIFEEQVQYEAGARVARWILDGRQAGDAEPDPDQTAAPALALPELAVPILASRMLADLQASDADPLPHRTEVPALLRNDLAVPSVAHRILDGRQATDADLFPDQTSAPALVPPELAFPSGESWTVDGRQPSIADARPNRAATRALLPSEVTLPSLARAVAQLAPLWDRSSAPEFSFDSMLEMRGTVALDLRSPFRCVKVSLDASAALRSLEHFAHCKPRQFGGSQNGPPNFATPASLRRRRFLTFRHCSPPEHLARCKPRFSDGTQNRPQNFATSASPIRCRFLAFRHGNPLQTSRSVSSRIPRMRFIRHQSVPRIVHHALVLSPRQRPAALDSVA
jgi:hypothetical protein